MIMGLLKLSKSPSPDIVDTAEKEREEVTPEDLEHLGLTLTDISVKRTPDYSKQLHLEGSKVSISSKTPNCSGSSPDILLRLSLKENRHKCHQHCLSTLSFCRLHSNMGSGDVNTPQSNGRLCGVPSTSSPAAAATGVGAAHNSSGPAGTCSGAAPDTLKFF